MAEIVYLITSRADFSCVKSVMDHLPGHTILCGSAPLTLHGDIREQIKSPYSVIWNAVEGLNTMAQSVGLLSIQLTQELEKLRPKALVVTGDRFECFAAMVASCLNIPIIHLQGGERTGNIDDRVRDSVSSIADFHFPATHRASERLKSWVRGIVRTTGCPSLDLVPEDLDWPQSIHSLGTGYTLTAEPYLLVIQHPVTTHWESAGQEIRQTINAIEKSGHQAVWIHPNIDAGSDLVTKELRQARDEGHRIRFFSNFSPDEFWRVMCHSTAMIGNSSAGIRQAPFLGVPAVNIGDRQWGREQAGNIVNCIPRSEDILRAIHDAIALEPDQSHHYGDGQAGKRIANLIETYVP